MFLSQRTFDDLIWGPWRDLERRNLFDTLLHGDASTGDAPAVNVWSNDDGALVRAQLPGLNADELELTVEGDTLVLRGARKAQYVDSKGDNRFVLRERGEGQFERRVRLPFTVASDEVEAHYKDGELEVRLPKHRSERPSHIKVTVA